MRPELPPRVFPKEKVAHGQKDFEWSLSQLFYTTGPSPCVCGRKRVVEDDTLVKKTN